MREEEQQLDGKLDGLAAQTPGPHPGEVEQGPLVHPCPRHTEADRKPQKFVRAKGLKV